MPQRTPSEDEQKRQRILDAAFQVCQERGVAAARMEEVAALAQVSKGTLYRFFRSKQELFLATIIASYEEGVRAVGPSDPEMDPILALDGLVHGLSKILALVTPRTRVHYQAWGVVSNEPVSQEHLYGFLREFHRDREREFEQLIRHGQVTGAFRADLPADVIAQSMGALLSGFIYRAAFDPDTASPEALQACLQTVIRDVLVCDDSARPREVEDG